MVGKGVVKRIVKIVWDVFGVNLKWENKMGALVYY